MAPAKRRAIWPAATRVASDIGCIGQQAAIEDKLTIRINSWQVMQQAVDAAPARSAE
jgi:hypothetical protein